MNAVAIFLCVFSALGALDYITGNHFGLGKKFEEGVSILGTLALSMIGMIIIAPLIAKLLMPLLALTADLPWMEPSVLAGSLLANDMGGTPLALKLAKSPEIGYFNGMIVGSMLGATMSFNLPVALGTTEKRRQPSVLLGLMAGIASVPAGSLIGGLIAGIPFVSLLPSVIPLAVFAVILSAGLVKAPETCVKLLRGFGAFVKALIGLGLLLGIAEILTGWRPVADAAPMEEGVSVCVSCACAMTGALPFLFVVEKLFGGGIRKLAGKAGINQTSALGFLATLATCVTTFSMMKDMDERGVVLNAAFAVPASFTLADHLAFTLANKPEYLGAVTAGKLISGVIAVAAASFLYARTEKKKETADGENA